MTDLPQQLAEHIEYAEKWCERLHQRSGKDSGKSARERKAQKYKAKTLRTLIDTLLEDRQPIIDWADQHMRPVDDAEPMEAQLMLVRGVLSDNKARIAAWSAFEKIEDALRSQRAELETARNDAKGWESVADGNAQERDKLADDYGVLLSEIEEIGDKCEECGERATTYHCVTGTTNINGIDVEQEADWTECKVCNLRAELAQAQERIAELEHAAGVIGHNNLKAECDRYKQRAERAEQAIEQAPHAEDCPMKQYEGRFDAPLSDPPKCNCWKALKDGE